MIPPVLIAQCPAKINLALRVLDRREDGYHELDTIFQTIDLWDRLEIRPAAELNLVCDLPGLPTDERNLVLRAARLLRSRYGPDLPGAALTLSKSIPVQGGLGGGSSDAAGALLLCSRFWGLASDASELAELGAELGADVPFFLRGGTARGLGRGDRIEPLPPLGKFPILIGLPPFGVSTAEVFSKVRERLTLPGIGVSLPLFSAPKWPEENDFHFAVNDLEAVVFESWPELERFRDALWRVGARSALLSGSGSAVYGIFADAEQLGRAEAQLRGRFERWTLMRTRAVDVAARVMPADG